MSDQKYQAGIVAGNSSSHALGSWPIEIPGLGKGLGYQPFGRCADCPPDTHPAIACGFVTYGGLYLCKSHANKRLRGATA